MKEELTSLRDKVKFLNRKIKAVKKDENNKSITASTQLLINPNCDFELCMEEDCVDTANPDMTK